MDKHIDLRLVKKVLYTPNKFEREYHTIQLMRKGKNVPETIDDLFVPLQYKDEEVPTNWSTQFKEHQLKIWRYFEIRNILKFVNFYV